MRGRIPWGLTLVLCALVPTACGQVLGLKDFKDAPQAGKGGSESALGGATANAKGGALGDSSGGTSAGMASSTGGASTVGSGGSDAAGSGGSLQGNGGSLQGNGGAFDEAGAGGTTGGGNSTGGAPTGPALSCAPDGPIVDLFVPPDLDIMGSQQDVDEESLVVVGDSGRIHVGIQRSDGQYVARSLSDGGNQSQTMLIWTKAQGDNHRFTRARVRLGKLEFFGMVRDSIAVLQVPVGSQGIAPGASNSAVIETLVRKPCPQDMFPAGFGVSFHAADYSLAVTCENQTTRSLQVYESQGDKLSDVAAGDVNDA
jgi:hypothetical protein